MSMGVQVTAPVARSNQSHHHNNDNSNNDSSNNQQLYNVNRLNDYKLRLTFNTLFTSRGRSRPRTVCTGGFTTFNYDGAARGTIGQSVCVMLLLLKITIGSGSIQM